MILESEILNVVNQQKNKLVEHQLGLAREFFPSLKSIASHALIISGIRRCGKSTLLLQLMQHFDNKQIMYLNFDSPQLFDFNVNDFVRLDRIIQNTGAKYLFFDELQLVEGWEIYIRQKLDEKYVVVITGSNASLLSKELGTRLTGRHITQELFPFSYNEFLKFKELEASVETLNWYVKMGGFPEYLKSEDEEQLYALFQDIIIRDVVVRYGIKDAKSLQRLATFLISNVGNRITANKLKQALSIGATSTVLAWFSYLESTYLFSFVPMFSYSAKVQLVNPRKVYAVDLGLASLISSSVMADAGRKLENLIFLHLRKQNSDIYFFDDNGECDFVVIKNGQVTHLIQVTLELNSDNLQRELNGLRKAMDFFNFNTGIIITSNNRDVIIENNRTINVIPAYEFLTQ